MKIQIKQCIFACLLLASLNSHAALNKWVDSDGNVHYSDEAPPADVNAQELTVPAAAQGATPAKSMSEQEKEYQRARKEKEEAEQKTELQQKAAELRQKNCTNARINLKTLENSPVISTYDANGNPTVMDDATRRQNIEENRKAERENCD
jgi:hypothetical protein